MLEQNTYNLSVVTAGCVINYIEKKINCGRQLGGAKCRVFYTSRSDVRKAGIEAGLMDV